MKLDEELRQVCYEARFSIADFARWCGLAKGSVRVWMSGKNLPNRYMQDYLKAQIELIRKVLAEKEKLPTPMQIRRDDRPSYVTEVKLYAVGKFSPGDTSNRRG